MAPRSLSLALRGLTRALAPATTLAAVQEIWERATGPAIAAAARPTAERAGVLEVSTDAAVWAQELDLMADQLIAAINSALGRDAIRQLRCRTAAPAPDASVSTPARTDEDSPSLAHFAGL